MPNCMVVFFFVAVSPLLVDPNASKTFTAMSSPIKYFMPAPTTGVLNGLPVGLRTFGIIAVAIASADNPNVPIPPRLNINAADPLLVSGRAMFASSWAYEAVAIPKTTNAETMNFEKKRDITVASDLVVEKREY